PSTAWPSTPSQRPAARRVKCMPCGKTTTPWFGCRKGASNAGFHSGKREKSFLNPDLALPVASLSLQNQCSVYGNEEVFPSRTQEMIVPRAREARGVDAPN